MTTETMELNKEVIFEVNGWAIMSEIGLYRSRYGIAVRTAEDAENTTIFFGNYDAPLSYLLAVFDPALLRELEGGLENDMPRDGEYRDPRCEVRASLLLSVRQDSEAADYLPLPFAEGSKVLETL